MHTFSNQTAILALLLLLRRKHCDVSSLLRQTKTRMSSRIFLKRIRYPFLLMPATAVLSTYTTRRFGQLRFPTISLTAMG